jgi:hypothetical protein
MPVVVNRDGDNTMLPQTDTSDRPKTPPVGTTAPQPSSEVNSLLGGLTPLQNDFVVDYNTVNELREPMIEDRYKPEDAKKGKSKSDQCEANRPEKKRKAEQSDPMLLKIQSPNGNTVTVAGDAQFNLNFTKHSGNINPRKNNDL